MDILTNTKATTNYIELQNIRTKEVTCLHLHLYLYSGFRSPTAEWIEPECIEETEENYHMCLFCEVIWVVLEIVDKEPILV